MKDMTKCQYEYKYVRRKCSHEALDGISICYWHEEITGKHPIKESGIKDFENSDLIEAFLRGANLGFADLQGANLGFADLQGANLVGAKFQGAILGGANLRGADLAKADLQGANLGFADLQGADLGLADLQGAHLYRAKFDNSNLWEAKIDEIVIEEKEGSYVEASQIYRNLKNYFTNEGIYERSGHYYYREMEMRRKQCKLFTKKWWIQNILHILCGYGEKPLWVVGNAILIVILGAISYLFSGIARVGAEIPARSSPYIINYSLNSLNLSRTIFNDLFYCLYYSVVTFTTLGYGDIHPVGKISHAISFIEAFVGAFFIALFVVVFVRKMAR